MLQMSRHILPGFLAAGLCICGFFWLREEVTTRIYQQKLEALAAEYSDLADQYNHAVRQSAITELLVTENQVTVLVRTIDGSVRQIETPFDPKQEIFVDYLVSNGRIWIRRLFDQSTPPEDGLLIEPDWDVIDWKNPDIQYGKAIYRSLQPGTWSIQVSGNGALSLEPAPESHPELLAAAPKIRTYEEIRIELNQEVESISFQDLWNFCISPLRE
jgi:hypothetical protein